MKDSRLNLPKRIDNRTDGAHTHYMNTNQTPATVTLSATNGRVAVTVAGQVIGTVKDGGQIIRNAEKILRTAGIVRTAGYDLDENRHMVAPAVILIGAVA